MKSLLILCALLSASAHATNVLYQRSSDPLTGAPAIFYATDEHDKVCKGNWYKAEIIDNDGKRIMRPTFCWTMVGLDTQGRYLGDQVLDIDAGYVQTNITLYVIQNPISGPAFVKIEMESIAADKILMDKLIQALYTTQPHP